MISLTTLVLSTAILILLGFPQTECGILKRRQNNEDEAVQTLLAVGLIAKALSDSESKGKNQCPPQVTKVIHVPMHHHTQRVYVVKEKDAHDWAESKNIWKKSGNVDWKR